MNGLSSLVLALDPRTAAASETSAPWQQDTGLMFKRRQIPRSTNYLEWYCLTCHSCLVVNVCLSVCVFLCARYYCFQVQVEGTWRSSRGRMTKTSSSLGSRYLADGKILADGKSADTFRSRCKFKSCQPPVLNIYTEHPTPSASFYF